MFLFAALALPAAIATTELHAVYCIALLTERARILEVTKSDAAQQAQTAESLKRLNAYLKPRFQTMDADVARAVSRARRQMADDVAEAGAITSDAEAKARLKTCDTLDWLS